MTPVTSSNGRHALDRAVAFLRDALTPDPMPGAVVRDRAIAAGFSPRTVDRAKTKLGIKSRKLAMCEGWWWTLPTDDEPPSQLQPEARQPLSITEAIAEWRHAQQPEHRNDEPPGEPPSGDDLDGHRW